MGKRAVCTTRKGATDKPVGTPKTPGPALSVVPRKGPERHTLTQAPCSRAELPRIPGKGLGPTCFSWTSELTLTLQISQWKVRSWAGASGSPGVGGPRRG